MLARATSPKRQRRKPGKVVKVELGNGNYALALVLNEPLVAFYDRSFSCGEVPDADFINTPIAFTLMVMNYAITSGRWRIVGSAEVPSNLAPPPQFCKEDPVSGKLSIYQELAELAPNYERAAKPGECVGLETAAVWEPEHVEDRLRDHFAGVPNKWVEQLRVQKGVTQQ
jgi:hypothetical protein